ncbi:desulfoferrodoxin [Pectinatus brassicae]|uniref:Desulfoferrodoxin n=1 Tax=Pectinatus brassicae TaxID=862415 RepID=A0A840UWZ5_9FIRM|nr:desulfoferrodoxin [Pectinatus brassicae]MBB5336915.1 superoxide reductase [Pectinatus brassicae]
MDEFVFYRCAKCGNIVAVMNNGGGTLVCCGEPMAKLTANTTDAAQEKHVPVVTKNGEKVEVAVGSTLHPMQDEHYIQWIALVADSRVKIQFLKPGEEPKAEFCSAASGTVYEYCNLHGLWKTDF